MRGDRLAVLLALTAAGGLVAACSGDDREARRRAAGADAGFADLMHVADAGAGARVFRQCAACHTISRGAPDLAGPNLHGVAGAAVAENRPRFGYTAALQQVGGRWTPERLDRWLAAPQRFAPGTSMRFAGLADPLDRADVIAYLQSRR